MIVLSGLKCPVNIYGFSWSATDLSCLAYWSCGVNLGLKWAGLIAS